MRLSFFAEYCLSGTFAHAHAAARTFTVVDGVDKQFLTDACAAFSFVQNYLPCTLNIRAISFAELRFNYDNSYKLIASYSASIHHFLYTIS
jgi:hypothetical protein